MKYMSIDIETYSEVDLAKSGLYRYAEDKSFEILLFSYSVDGKPVEVIDLASGEKIPDEIVEAIKDNNVIKWAYNAQFERICLSAYFSDGDIQYLDPSSWRCSMVWVATLGLPTSLEAAGNVLNIEEQKLSEGKDLIRYFSVPCTATKANGGRTRNLPKHAPEKWELFKAYNQRDVEAEMAIQKRLAKYPVSDEIWEEYRIDQLINDRGIKLDMEIVDKAVEIDLIAKERISARLKAITGLDNPNSVKQMKEWLSTKGVETESLDKKAVAGLIETVPESIAEALRLRQQISKSSVKKYQAMQNAVCRDGRAHGMFMFYGAPRTGRWSGRNIQLQNLPQNHMQDLEEARALIKEGNYEVIDSLYDNVPNVLSELVRTAFVAAEGKRLIVADYSAIEARVLAWQAGEGWRNEAFRDGKDIYCASASQMFHVPVEKHGQNAELRQKGKIAELALGYGGSVGALKAMGALDMGLSEEDLKPLVDTWRRTNPAITRYWWNVDKAVKTAISDRTRTRVGRIKFEYRSGMLFVHLPSGRRLSYVKPRLERNKYGSYSVTYMGTSASKKWERLESYGPKFVENIVQGVARDILAYAMKNLSGYQIVAHVHDEIVIEAGEDVTVEDICKSMSETPLWADGLILRADGYETVCYRKD